MRVLTIVLAMLAFFSPAVAGERLVQSAVISKPGDPVEVRGTLSRVLGFFDRQGDRLAVTFFISGNARGPVLRGGARLADGQRYSLQREAAGRAETVEIRRRGDEIVLSVSSGLRVARKVPAEEEPILRAAALD
ncbi:MAG: hypothetical protein AAFP17_18500 [Pseudomonadota bacterium]